MEIEASGSGGSGGGSVTISATTFSVNANEEPLELEELELPDTVFRSRHHQLLNSLVTDDSDDYGDIQFFHHHSHIQQQFQFQHQQQQQHHDHFILANGTDEGVDDASHIIMNPGANMNGNHSNTTSSDPFLMDQFFPGRSIEGYLETILEETDEENEEDGCSGRHWWVADSDTDTESVIRVDSDCQSKNPPNKTTDKNLTNDVNQIAEIEGGKNTFRTTASSKPFEGHLFDQLDFDFEETLMSLEPRRRCGIVQAGEQSSRAEQPFEKVEKCETVGSVIRNNNVKSVSSGGKEHLEAQQSQDNVSYLLKYGNGKCSELDDEEIQPAEVNEEDFFYTTSEEEDSEGTSGENSEPTSSDDGEEEGKNDGVVLAEFSLNSSMCNRYRRSFEGGAQKFNIVTGGQLKSFRSFDSLNSLSGTELLFSKADTFPSFHYIKEVTEPSSPSTGVEVEGGRDRKNSDSSAGRPTEREMSTENLSEDSGIGGDGTGIGSALNLNLNSPQQQLQQQQQSTTPYSSNLPSISSANESLSYIAKSEFALNPFVFSSASASEENSMNSSLFHAVGGLEKEQQQIVDNFHHGGGGSGREEKREEFCSSSSSSSVGSNVSNQTVIMRSAPEIKKDDNCSGSDASAGGTMVVEGKECEGTHPTLLQQQAKIPSSSTRTTAGQVGEFAQQQLLSSVEPDVVAQCNMMMTKTTAEVGEPGAIPPIVVMKKEFEGPPPLVNRIGGDLTCAYPTPHSEVLLKFVDEDLDVKNDFSKSGETMKKKSESEFCVEGEDGANNVDRLAHSRMIIESMVSSSGDVDKECVTMSSCVSDGQMKSGPMSALSDGTTPLTGLTLMMMTLGSPSLAQNNNSETPTPSPPPPPTTSTSHCKESLLLESELPSASAAVQRGKAYTATEAVEAVVSGEEQEQEVLNVGGGESVCVQTSGWTNVVHHSVGEEEKGGGKGEGEESVEFISGSSNFGCTRKSLEGNLDPQSGSESLALPEHLCNSRNSSSSTGTPLFSEEEILCPADNDISTSEHNLNAPSPSTVVIENTRKKKPGSSHSLSPSSPRALQGERCTDESLSSSPFVPDILSLPDTIQPTSFTTPILPSSPQQQYNPPPPSVMEVMERRNMSPSSSSSSSMQPAIRTKTYGPRNEVEVFLVSSRTPSPSMKTNSPEGEPPSDPVNAGKVVKKEVHFCPVVSEISWRESYTDQGSEFSESSDNLLDDQDSICVDDNSVDGRIENLPPSKMMTESVTVSEQVTQPIENIVLLSSPHNNSDKSSGMMTSSSQNSESGSEISKIMSRNHHFHSKENTNGHVYEDVGGHVVDLKNLTVSPSQQQQSQNHPQPSTLSMVPDLLSQCENASQSHTHISVKIEEKAVPPQQQQQQQQQIFPSIFADKNEGKNGNKSKSKSSGKSFNIPLGTGGGGGVEKSGGKKSEKLRFDKDINNREEVITKDNNPTPVKSKVSKPGFFERLSKIRLSGGTKNKNKKKVHPKENENVVPSNDQSLHNNDDDSSGPTSINNSSKSTQLVKGKSPILKKWPANGPPVHSSSPSITTTTSASPIITHYDAMEAEAEVERSSEAFEKVLDDIAGINVIKLRQQQHGRLVLGGPPSPAQKEPPKVRSFAERKQFFVNLPKSGGEKGATSPLDAKLTQFKEETTRTRDQISKSHPDLEVIEGVTRDSLSVTIEPSSTRLSLHHPDQRDGSPFRHRPTSSPSSSSPHHQQSTVTTHTSPESGMRTTEEKTEREWYRLLKSAAEKNQKNFRDKERNFRTGVVETDLDTGASREMLHMDVEVELGKVPCTTTANKTRSLTNLSSTPLSLPQESNDENLPPQGDLSDSEERAKSLEFLLDENHKSCSVPPENKLRLESRQLSEHELRIQRSLQKLNVPEWYKKSVEPSNGSNNTTKSTSSIKLLKRSEFGSGSALAGRQGGWSAYRSSRESLMSPSSFETLSSFQNNGGRYSGSLNRSNFVRGRPTTRSSRESLLSPSSTASQSPSAFERCSFTYGMPLHLTRFNSRLSTGSGSGAASISPPSTPVNPVNPGPTYVKKPYLGWRSQEKLNANVTNPTPNSIGSSSGQLRLSIYRPPAERLAAEILSSRTNEANSRTKSNKPRGTDLPPLPPPRAEKTVLTNKNPELIPSSCTSPSSVHDSIREVTQQINQFVHHVDSAPILMDQPPKPKPRQKTGKRTTLWIESSFVG